MTISLKNSNSIPITSQSEIFRDVSWRGLIGAGVLFGLVAGFAALPKADTVNWAVVLIPGATACGFIFLGLWRRCFGSTNSWLLLAVSQGVYINIGYSGGYTAPTKDTDVLFIPREDIAAVASVREAVRLPHRFGATRHHLGNLDILLKNPAPETIREATAYYQELYYAAQKAGPFPIRFLAPSRLRLCWSAVAPNEAEALKRLATMCPIAPACRIVYPEWNRLNKTQRDMYLNELWQMGMRDEAVFLGRIHLGISRKQTQDTLKAAVHRDTKTGN